VLTKTIFSLCLIALFLFDDTRAAYIQNEICTIFWGNAPDHLRITEPLINGVVSDSTEYDIAPGSGPTCAIVDRSGNIIICSYDFSQLKGFNPNGELIFNFSSGEAQYDPDICKGSPKKIIVDSLNRLYITSFESMSYVPIVDYGGKILDKLYPFSDTANTRIISISQSPSGNIFICEQTQGWITYTDGSYMPGGGAGLLAADGYFYSAYMSDSDFPINQLFFNKYMHPDGLGGAEYIDTKQISLGNDSLEYATTIIGGNGSSIFVYAIISQNGQFSNVVWEYDLDYSLLNTLVLPSQENRYDWSIKPFVALDNSIYEFRCLDDGLHVIKWTKQ
jgi:hypothetical protein